MQTIRVGFWTLRHKNGDVARKGDTLVDFRGDTATLMHGDPPHKPSSIGRVYVRANGCVCSFYPSVFDLKWERAS